MVQPADYLLVIVHTGCDDPILYYVDQSKVPDSVMRFIKKNGDDDEDSTFSKWWWGENEDGMEKEATKIKNGDTLPVGKVTVRVYYCY